MGELTVKECYKKYPSMTDRDMARLLGTNTYTENTLIPAAAVANYNGKNSQPISVFYAEHAPQKFIPLLGESKQQKIMTQAQIDPKRVTGVQQKVSPDNKDYRHFGSNDMNKSIFDIEKERRKKKLIY